MRNIIYLLLLLACKQPVCAQIFLVDTNAHYFEDFNGLDSFGTGSVKVPPGWAFSEFGSAANTTYRAGTGSVSTSDTYSFGPLRSRDRALGSLASGTLPKIVYGTMFVNQTGADINAMNVSFRGEQWRRGGSGAADSLHCYFSTVRGTKLHDSSGRGWTEVPALLFRSVSTLTGGATLNGNDSFRLLHADIPLMLHPGDTLWLRWADFNAAGSDDGLAIDSLSIDFRNGDALHSLHPMLEAFSPDSNSSGLAPDLDLLLRFDRSVTPGPGYISVWNLETNRIDRVPTVDGRPGRSGREFVFTGLVFDPGSRYVIRFDSSAFDSLGYACTGFYSTDWQFRVAPAGIATAGSTDPLSLDMMQDGRMLLRVTALNKPLHLKITGVDGRAVRDQLLWMSAGTQLIDPGLPRGSCYGVSVSCKDIEVRKLLCVP